MLIDMHAHVIPERFPPAANRPSAGAWPAMDHFEPGRANVMIGGKNYRTVHSGNWDVERRLADMEASGVDAEVVSPMPELTSYWFSAEDGLDFCSYLNDFIVELCSHAPGRLFGMGIVPLQDPDLAARELTRIKASGLSGIEVGSNVNSASLGDSRFRDFFQEADRLGVPVFVHALRPTFMDRLPAIPALANSIGFPTDTGLTIASLIAGGTAESCPNLRIAFSHGGGTFPFMLPRFQNGYSGTWNEEPESPERAARRSGNLRAPVEYARRFFYDTLLFDARAIRYLMEYIGPSQLLVGSDYPYLPRENPVARTLRGMGLEKETLEDITWFNCFRFLGVEAP